MVLLVRFGELALKSRYVRRQLLDRLVGNIQDLFAAEGIECLTRSDHGRVYGEVDAEVRENRAYVFAEVVEGPGGLPMGSQGRGLALVDSEAGIVSAWLAMKRGCKITVAAPDGGRLHEALRRWDVHLKVLSWEPGM